MLLYVAGEKLRFAKKVTNKQQKKKVKCSQNSCQRNYINIRLSHICREAIRNHLLEVDPHTNLFERVPKLTQLPSSLREFLLFDLTLEIFEGDDSVYCSSEQDSEDEGFYSGETSDEGSGQ